ncbi:MAG: cell envelope-related transcriptional attenuator [Acidimicrobiales bacterium]|jgi:LCP family protein required for cell wall assembly|nr:cell envelope-related transcriptional attenuator [Acidimicrobiales bacterium]
MDTHGIDDPTSATTPGSPPPTDHGTLLPSPGDPNRGRRNRRRVVKGIALALIIGTIAIVIGFGYTVVRLGQVRRITVSGITPVGPDQPQTILLTGSDSRAGQSAAAAQHFGSASQVAGQRSDVIILIHLDPGHGKASMLSIPRDLLVPIAGTGSSNRINTAFDASPSRLIQTITQNFGITINHYAQEDFTGLQGIAGAVGGVCMSFPYPVRDGSPSGTGNESGLNIPTSGPHTLDGGAALALVRSRYYQYFANGRWNPDGSGDIGRIERQHTFMRALAAKALHKSLTNPFTANAVLGKAVHNITVDSSFTAIGMARLGLNLRSVRPSDMPSWTLPYRAVNNYRGYGDVLLPDPTLDAQVIAAWQNYGATPTASQPVAPTVNPASVTVSVMNGSGVAGQAAQVAGSLGAMGFHVTDHATAPTRVAKTTITYGTAGKADAQVLAARIKAPVVLELQSNLRGSTVVLTTGADFGGVARPAAPTTNPSSTATPSTAARAPSPPPWDPIPC